MLATLWPTAVATSIPSVLKRHIMEPPGVALWRDTPAAPWNSPLLAPLLQRWVLAPALNWHRGAAALPSLHPCAQPKRLLGDLSTGTASFNLVHDVSDLLHIGNLQIHVGRYPASTSPSSPQSPSMITIIITTITRSDTGFHRSGVACVSRSELGMPSDTQIKPADAHDTAWKNARVGAYNTRDMPRGRNAPPAHAPPLLNVTLRISTQGSQMLL